MREEIIRARYRNPPGDTTVAGKRDLSELAWPVSVCCALIAFAIGIILALRC